MHLNLEQLARLVDEPAEPAEAAHLRDCLVCALPISELRAQTRALASLPDPEPSAFAWAALEGRLRQEGLVRDTPSRPLLLFRPGLRIAAALVLMLIGAGGALLLSNGSPGTVEIGRAS